MKLVQKKLKNNNYETINSMGIKSKEIYSTIIKYLISLNNNMLQTKTNPNKVQVLAHTFISKIITVQKLNADKNKKLVLLYKFITFIERAKDQQFLDELHNNTNFKQQTDKMINRYIYNIKNEDDEIKPKSPYKIYVNKRNEERYEQAMKEQALRKLTHNQSLNKIRQKQLNLIKQTNSIKHSVLQMKELNLSKMYSQILNKEFLKQLFTSILGNNEISILNLSGALNTANFDDVNFKLLLTYIKSNTSIKELDISKCNINYKDFNRIVDAMFLNLKTNNDDFKMSRLIFNNNNIIPYNDYFQVNNNVMRDFNTSLQNLMTKFNALRILSFKQCSLDNNFLKEITQWLPNTSVKEIDLSFNNSSNGGSINDDDILELIKKLTDKKYNTGNTIVINFRDNFNIGIDEINNTNAITIHNVTIIVNDETIKQ